MGKTNSTEEGITSRLSKGDKAAFTETYQTYFEPLCCYAYRYFPKAGDAEEIVQDVLLKFSASFIRLK
jgi:DNA-directed RNA polymerase specialized sigma24 family protein